MNSGRFASPKPLLAGGTIGLFAPSGVVNLPRMRAAIDALTARGYDVVNAPDTDKQWRYFAGSDEARLGSFHTMLADPAVDAMMMVRGGYGWSRLLHRIDWHAVAASTKTFVGFSDFTAFNLAALAQANLVTFAGPGAATDFGGGEDSPETQADHAFMEAHCWPALAGEPVSAGPFDDSFTYRPRTISGPLWGSNLSLLTHLVGTPYLPNIDGGILYLEEIGEAPYAVERMLLQLFHAGILQKQKALILADFSDCAPEPDRFPYAMAHVVETMLQPALIPVFTLGLALSLFLAISYVICISGYLLLPGLPIQHSALAIFLPGFQLLTWRTFFLGLGESFLWGWYFALVFGPLYNFLAARRR